MENENRILLCQHCIEAIRSHGEPVYVGDFAMDVEESEETNTPCEWCGEYDELYDCKF